MRSRGRRQPSAPSNAGAAPTGPRPWDRLDFGIAALVALAAAGAFLPVVGNGFVEHWDDQSNFLENRAFRGLGWPQLRWACTTTWLGVYQPIGWMLLELEYLAWGLDPRGYHLASLILHGANAVLLYALIRTLVARAMPAVEESRSLPLIPVMSGLAAAVFAVHPLRVEVVAWASCQTYLPSAGFALLSVLAYVRGCAGASIRPGWHFASVVLYVVALGFKVVPVGLPFVLLVLDLSVLGRRDAGRSLRALVVEKVPYLIAAVAAAAVAIHAKEVSLIPEPALGGLARTAAQRAAAAGYSLVYYLEATVWPCGLSAYHFRPDPIEPAAPQFAGRLAAAAGLGAAAYHLRRRWPAIPAALLSYAILEAPNLGLVQHGLMLVADRYAYVPTMPLFVVAAGGLVRGLAAARRPMAAAATTAAVGLGVVAILAAMSLSLSRTWHDSGALWAHALKIGSGRDALLETHLGIEMYRAGRTRDGIAHLRKAVEIDPNEADARVNLGIALLKQGDDRPGITHMTEAVRLAPDRPDYRHGLGEELARRGRFDEALPHLEEAVRLDPVRAEIRVTLGNVLVDLRRLDEAFVEFNRALLIAPGHPGAQAGLQRLRGHGRPGSWPRPPRS
jgi:Flp pilus assembly protein TadD